MHVQLLMPNILIPNLYNLNQEF